MPLFNSFPYLLNSSWIAVCVHIFMQNLAVVNYIFEASKIASGMVLCPSMPCTWLDVCPCFYRNLHFVLCFCLATVHLNIPDLAVSAVGFSAISGEQGSFLSCFFSFLPPCSLWQSGRALYYGCFVGADSIHWGSVLFV